MILRTVRQRLARLIYPLQRMYAAARQGRLTAGWQANQTSADAELNSSLDTLRARSRALVRDNAYARRARTIIVNNVIGSGIGLQAAVQNNRKRLVTTVNDGIEAAWEDWARAENCHVGGALHFSDLERLAMGEVFEAGEVFIRKHYRAVGASRVALSLEVIEAERVAASYTVPNPTHPITMGVEHDQWHRPVAYWFRTRHPNEPRLQPGEVDALVRIPAREIIHLRLVKRWPQTRGEPWLHAVSSDLNDMGGYIEAEIVAARASASIVGFIQRPEADAESTVAGQQQMQMEPGMIEHLAPGEEFNGFAPNRPNTGADPFLRMMLRKTAAGVDVSYESLSRDYSQSNYSSSRLALLDDRDTWRHLQAWFIRSLRDPLYREWLGLAVLGGAIRSIGAQDFLLRREYYEQVRFKPRGWSWVDPTKEVEAYKQAVLCGFATVSDVIAATGGGADLEDVLNARRRELDLMQSLDLSFESEPAAPVPDKAAPDDAEDDA
jgi:lambda family phage portal protein